MLLRQRIVLFFALASAALAALASTPPTVLWKLTQRDLNVELRHSQQDDWREALRDTALSYDVATLRLGDDLKSGRASDVQSPLRAEPGPDWMVIPPARAILFDADGRAVGPSEPDPPPVTWDALRRWLTVGNRVNGIVRAADGSLLFVAARRFRDGAIALITVPASALTGRLTAMGWGDVFLADDAGHLIDGTSSTLAPVARKALRDRLPTSRLLHGGRDYQVINTAIISLDGSKVGRLLTVQEERKGHWHRLTLKSTFALVSTLLVVLCWVLYLGARRALQPLSDVTEVVKALAAGDASARAEIPDRSDEVGTIARAVEVFRRHAQELKRRDERDRLRITEQHALIRREMAKLAATLPDSAREEVAEELHRIEAEVSAASGEDGEALAAAFRQMAGRVIFQHKQLSKLLDERTRDLAAVSQALAEHADLVRMREELNVARALQLSNLPPPFPALPERRAFALHAVMKPAREVGGDTYDHVLLEGNRLAVAVADASGKGVSAAMFIAVARGLLRSALTHGASPAESLAVANATLAADNGSAMFATAFVGVLDLSTGQLIYASAGHNPPYLLRPGAALRALSGSAGIALGAVEDALYVDAECSMKPDDCLLLYTDGVTEACSPERTLFGEARLEGALRDGIGLTPDALIALVSARVAAFVETSEQADDITLLACRYDGQCDRTAMWTPRDADSLVLATPS